jgi:hypothetical protein
VKFDANNKIKEGLTEAEKWEANSLLAIPISRPTDALVIDFYFLSIYV